jgi:hypothetical protein
MKVIRLLYSTDESYSDKFLVQVCNVGKLLKHAGTNASWGAIWFAVGYRGG